MLSKKRLLLITATSAVLALGSAGLAAAHSGGGGVHGGGGGFHGGGGLRGAGYRGAWFGRGGYGHGWHRGGFYAGWGFGYGLFFAGLPWYYDTYWWNGVPYYYADDTFYQWDHDAGAYETVPPPTGLADQIAAAGPPAHQLFVYPKSGQTIEQIARDREDCHRWAVSQTGFDPRAQAEAPDAATAGKPVPAEVAAAKRAAVYRRADYYRAEGACLQGRNYSVN